MSQCATNGDRYLTDLVNRVRNQIRDDADAKAATAAAEGGPTRVHLELFRRNPGLWLDGVYLAGTVLMLEYHDPAVMTSHKGIEVAVILPADEYARLIELRNQVTELAGDFKAAD